jgi:hypothetical protein
VTLFVLRARSQIVNRSYVDEFNRVRIFHGVNVVVKSPPYLPPTTPEFNPLDSLVRRIGQRTYILRRFDDRSHH